MLLFVKQGAENRFGGLEKHAAICPLNLVHPKQYLDSVSKRKVAEKALWEARSELVLNDINMHLGKLDSFVLLDDGKFQLDSLEARVSRVLETDGVYMGVPANGIEAIKAIQNFRKAGAKFIVQTWLSYWWAEIFSELEPFLVRETERLLSNDRCRILKFTK